MRSYWFGDVDGQRCSRAEGDLDALARRAGSIGADTGEIVPADWRMARECGAVKDRSGYISTLREICIRAAEARIAEAYRESDAELIRMVMALDGIDLAVNRLAGHLADWYRVLHPAEGWKYRPRDAARVLARIGEDSEGPLKEMLGGIRELREIRTRLAREISDRAVGVLPNCSRLVGGLVAARLMTRAGGLRSLSELPASSIQVLGAKGALFSHLTRGTPPPKHGIIYQHQRVHNAPRGARGRVARVLAGRLAIAARIDRYRGEADEGFIKGADRMIESAGERP